jgi:hypothetical protein
VVPLRENRANDSISPVNAILLTKSDKARLQQYLGKKTSDKNVVEETHDYRK